MAKRHGDDIALYDEQNFVTYLHLLDAEAGDADWTEVRGSNRSLRSQPSPALRAPSPTAWARGEVLGYSAGMCAGAGRGAVAGCAATCLRPARL